MAGKGIDLGGIYAELDIRTGNLDQGLAKARQALDAVNKEIVQLQQDFADGAISAADLGSRMAALGATATDLTTRMQAAYTATTTLHTGLEILNANANQMTQSSGRMGQALMQLGYIADDVQYGFSGIVNNIGPLAYGLGASGGLAAAAQLAAVAVYQLYTHWDQFTDLLGVGTVRTEAEEMERLGKATSRTADEQDRLNKFKEQEKRIQQMLSGRSAEEEATGKAVQDIYDEAGPKKLAGALAAQMKAPITPEQQKKLDDAKLLQMSVEKHAAFLPAASQKNAILQRDAAINEVEEARNEEAKKRAAKLMDQAKLPGPEGDQARRSIMTKLGDPGNPLYNVAMQLGSASPEARANAKKKDAEADEKVKREKEAEAEAKKAEAEAKRLAAEKEQDRQKELGRMGYLEERAGQGKNTKGEQAELARLLQDDVDKQRVDDEQKQRALDADRKKELGPIGYLEEQATKRKLTGGEQAELGRLKEADGDKKFREARQEREANEKEAREIAPGIGKMSDMLAMQAMAGAITPDQARDAIAKQLGRQGVDAEKTVQAADLIFEESDKDVREGVVKRMFGDKGEKTKNSEVFDANTVAARFQSSVGGDTGQKMLSLTERMEKHLDLMAKAGVLNVRIKKS